MRTRWSKKAGFWALLLVTMGAVYQFADTGLSNTKPEKEEEKPPAPHGFTPKVKVVTTHGHKAKTIDPAKYEATKKVYEKWVKEKGVGTGPMPLEAMQEIYRTGDFETVKTLIENKVVIPEHSTDMADHRVLMILQTWERIVDDSGGKERVHRSDSGNQQAGMSSDVDQTIYIEKLVEGKWIRAEDVDGKMVEKFKVKFEEMHKIKVEALDIATIAGRDKYPDWRVTSVQLDAEGKRDFRVHAAETMFTLRRTPGAYTYCGAVVQQMQLRVLDAMEKQLRPGESAPEVKEPREIRVKELREHNKDFRLNHLLFNTIEADPETGKAAAHEAFREDATRVMFDGVPPKLVEGHAYDAAVANYFEFLHHLNDKVPAVKYHLRALDDGFQMLERLRKGEARFEYANVHKDHRTEHLQRIFGESLSKAPPDLNGKTFLSRWETAFNISAELRDLHSKKKLTDESAENAFKALAEEIAVADKENWKKYLPEARKEYNRRCQEFMVYNMCETSHTRIGEFLAPDPDAPEKRAFLEKVVDEGTMRKQLNLEGKRNDAKWAGIREEFLRNYGEQARLQLLYSFRELNATRPDIVEFILKEAEKRGRTPEQMKLLHELNADSKSMFFGLREFAKFPRTYAQYAQLAARASAKKYAASMMEHLAGEYGFIETPHGRRPTALLKQLGMTGLHGRVTVLMKQHRLLGITDRFLGNTFLNIGGLQSGVNVVRAYSESGGDPDALRAAVIREAIMILPGIGQVAASYEAGSDWKQQLLIIVPLLVPELGIVMAVYGIAEGGIAIYECEYIKPLGNDIADALYRGYVGPSLYDFSQESHPPEFTEEDKKNLERAKAEVKRFGDRMKEPGATKGDAQALAIAGRDEKVLSVKESAWKAYLAEEHRYEGSAIAGTGRHMKQEVLEVPPPEDKDFKGHPIGEPGPLLARIKPVIFYSRNMNEGPVLFETKPLTAEQATRLEELTKQLEAEEIDPLKWVDMEVEQSALAKQKKMYERAQRYLEAAKKNPDLLLQIRRDSLWPNLMKEEGVGGKGWAREHVAMWVAVRKSVLPDALKKVNVVVNDDVKPHTAAVLDAMGERLEADLERSRRLWLINQVTEEARAKWEKEQVEKKRGAMMAEALHWSAGNPPMTLSEAAQKVMTAVGIDPLEAAALTVLAESYLQRCVPESGPAVEIGVRRVISSDSENKSPYEFRADVKVTANPAIYVPPYSAFTYSLDPKAAAEAVGSRTYRGLPLSDDMVASLQEYLKENPPQEKADPEKDKFSAAVLTFVFCADVRIPERVVPETIADLPRLKAYDIPFLEGMTKPGSAALAALDDEGKPVAGEGALRGYLFGGGAFSPPQEEAGPSSPIKIALQRVDFMMVFNNVVVTGEALSQLETAKPEQGVCLTLERGVSGSGPWEKVAGPQYHFGKGPPGPGAAQAQGEVKPITMSDSVYDGFVKGTLKYQPLYYRVCMQAVTRASATTGPELSKPVGKPVYSNIAGPGQALVRMGMRRPPEEEKKDELPGDGRLKMQKVWIDTGVDNNMYVVENSGGWISFTSQLILPDQYYDFPGTHYVVTCGSFTGHYFDPPARFPQKAGGSPGWLDKPSIKVPFAPKGGTINITATAEGGSASRTITLVIAPKLSEEATKQDQKMSKWSEGVAASRQKEVADTQATIKRYQDQVAESAKNLNQAWGAFKWCDNSMDVERTKYRLATRTEYEWPNQDAYQRSMIARNMGDYGVVLEMAEAQLAAYEKQRARTAEYYKAMIELNGKKLAYAQQFKTSTDTIEQEGKSLKETADREEQSFKNGLSSKYTAIMSTAVSAGNSGKYKAALEKTLGLYRADGKASSAANLMINSAEDYVMVTGDRSGGAAMLKQGWEEYLGTLKGEEAERSRKQHEAYARPSWWPE